MTAQILPAWQPNRNVEFVVIHSASNAFITESAACADS